jgi:hypothetical protein
MDDLGSRVAEPVAAGTTEGAPDRLTGACGSNDGPERTFRWTAPRAGRWLWDTAGSGYDTLLFIRDASCDGEEIACNDDGAADLSSQVSVELDAGQTIVVVVTGWANERGEFLLNVRPAGSDG